MCGGVRPLASHDPYPIYEKNLGFFPTLLIYDQKFSTLFINVAVGTVAINIINEGLFDDGLFVNDEKTISLGPHILICYISAEGCGFRLLMN